MRFNLRYFSLSLLLSAMTVQAQNFSDNWLQSFFVGDVNSIVVNGDMPAKAPRRAAADGVFYQRPEGAFYEGLRPADWSYYPVTKIVVQPWQEFTYLNRCADQNVTWNIEGNSVTADSQGNFSETIQPIPDGYIDHYLPTIVKDGVSYTLGEGHLNWDKYHASVAWADSIVEMSVFDPGRIIGKNGSTVYTNFRPLSMTNGLRYNFGTMSFTSGGNTYYSRGVRQFFEKPMGRLWVEDIIIPAISYSSQLLPAGKVLTMTIKQVNDDMTYGETIATLTCSASDILNLGSQNVSDGTVKMATLQFKPEGELIIDQAFAIEIEGFQEDGVDVGLAAALVDACDKDLCTGSYILLQNASHQNIGSVVAQPDRVPCISIRGMYDGVKMVTTGSNLSLTATKEGGACTLEGSDSQAKVQLKTAIRWNYGEANANYTIEGLPEWLHVIVDESKRDINGKQFGNGLVTLTFNADAVPENTLARQATLYIKGKGVQTDTPIVVSQEGTATDGIQTIQTTDETNQPVYNLNGQRVVYPRPGVYIISGKKVILK